MQIQPQHHLTQNNTCRLPWSHFEFENFLTEQDFVNVQRKILSFTGEFHRLLDDPEQINFAALPDLDFAKFLLSKNFRTFLENKVSCQLKIHEKSAVQLRKMTPESPDFPAHCDFIDQRSLVTLFYISPSWTTANGGELIMLPKETTPIHDPSTKWISPVANKLVMFFSDKNHWHCVRKVQNWDRYLVTAEWLVQSPEGLGNQDG